MPKVNGLLISVDVKLPVIEVSYKLGKADNYVTMAATLLTADTTSQVVTTTTPDCVLLHCGKDSGGTINKVASDLANGEPIYGPALALQRDQEEGAEDKVGGRMNKELKSRVQTSRKRGRNGPTRAKGGWDFFLAHFKTIKTKEMKEDGETSPFKAIQAMAQIAWDNLSTDEKQLFNDKAAADKIRFKSEMEHFNMTNPKPPKKPRLPHSFYQQHTKDTPPSEVPIKPWKELKDIDEKAPFVQQSKEDEKRYEQEYSVYQEYCSKNNMSCGPKYVRKARGPRKPAEPSGTQEKPTKVELE